MGVEIMHQASLAEGREKSRRRGDARDGHHLSSRPTITWSALAPHGGPRFMRININHNLARGLGRGARLSLRKSSVLIISDP